MIRAIQVDYLYPPGTVVYNDLVGPTGLSMTLTLPKSDTFASNFFKAYGLCRYNRDPDACQLLGNLCVLLLYSEDQSVNPNACLAYQGIAQGRRNASAKNYDAPADMPWLYYGLLNTYQDSVTITDQIPYFRANVSGATGTNTIPLVLASYALNGTFLGLQNLTTQLQLCTSGPVPEMTDWLQMGHDYEQQCTLNLFKYLNMSTTTIFYDLYMLDQNNNLFPIPVRITNFRSGGRLVNSPDKMSYANNRLFRRFFLLDNVRDGVSVSEAEKLKRGVVAHSIRKANNDGQIYVPVVDITYSERATSGISENDPTFYSSPTFTFSATYVMSLDNFYNAMRAIFSIVSIGAGLLAFYQARAWSLRNLGQGEGWDTKYLIRAVLVLAGCVAPFFFWFLFFVSIYWFFFFKNQDVLKLFLPSSTLDITNFVAVLATACICQIAFLGKELHRQCTSAVFFLDWEKSRGRLLTVANEQTPRPAPVSVWRTIFMANHWTSLQTCRRINVELSLIAMYFILSGLGLRYTATSQPNLKDLSPGPTHPILIFAIDSMIWVALVSIQFLYRVILHDRFYKNRLLNFIDILSLSNVSLLVFDETCHGYYVHGRSVHPNADTDVGELNANLRKEESDMVPRRGLQDTDQQSFELFAQRNLRTTFDKIYGQVAAGDSGKKRAARRLNRLTKDRRGRARGAQEPVVQAYDTINRFLLSFFDKNLKEYQYAIRQKSYFEKFLGTTPDVSQTSILFHDETAYASVLLYGIEHHLLLFNILIFTLVDVVADHAGAAAVVTYVADLLVRIARRHFGEVNVAEKTMLDWKFLI
ncbi:Meckelin [Borealophlyctis nickersoniae]|nr:Meckelin [Borealophlyctis nickersoniae]